jgi:hypothetical protein
MAWIEQHRRADGGLTARVIWRPGGARGATRVWETLAPARTRRISRARTVSSGWSRSLVSGGPDGWVKGEGFVRPPDVADL